MARPVTARKKTYVRRSPIAGRGLFAGRDFKRGDRIMRGRIKKHHTDHGAYIVMDRKGQHYQILNKARFLNHAMPPNAKWMLDDWIVALRSIGRGEEITLDYGEGCRPGVDT